MNRNIYVDRLEQLRDLLNIPKKQNVSDFFFDIFDKVQKLSFDDLVEMSLIKVSDDNGDQLPIELEIEPVKLKVDDIDRLFTLASVGYRSITLTTPDGDFEANWQVDSYGNRPVAVIFDWYNPQEE